jgi:hypothetical protein
MSWFSCQDGADSSLAVVVVCVVRMRAGSDSSVQAGMIIYEREQVMYSESSEAFVLRQPKAHGSLKCLQVTRLVFSIQKSLSVTIGTICESVCAANYCSQAPVSPSSFFLSSACLSFCTCSLRLLSFPASRPCRLLASARVGRESAVVWTY